MASTMHNMKVIEFVLPSGANGSVSFKVPLGTRNVGGSGPLTFRVTGIDGVLAGTGVTGGAITLKNGSDAITDAIDCTSGKEGKLFSKNGEPSTWDTTKQDVTEGNSIVVAYASTSANFPGATVWVRGYFRNTDVAI